MGWSWLFGRRKPAVEDATARDDAPDDEVGDPAADGDEFTDADGFYDNEAAAAAAAPPLTDELDLHTFRPRDCGDVVTEYVHAAQQAGFATVRIIHGKGKGMLRRSVHSVLAKHPAVRSFRLADQRSGSWGATLAELHPATDPKADEPADEPT